MNKVQKIREWVKARLGENTSKQSLPQFYGMMEEDARFLNFLDSIQKEPTGNPLGSTHAEFRTAVESLGISQEEHDRIVDECIYGKESELVDVDDLPNKKEEPVSEDLEEAANNFLTEFYGVGEPHNPTDIGFFKAGAKWQKEHLWKPADGDDLPDIDREVIALLDNGKVVFAHRPPEYWDGKDIITGKVTRNYPKTYDKGGWNIPDIKFWLDIELPK